MLNAPIIQAGDLARRALSDHFNRTCACLTLDRKAMHRAMGEIAGDDAFVQTLIETRPHLASNTATFVSRNDLQAMGRIVEAAETASRLAGWRASALRSDIAGLDFGTAGVFMGYDFHLTPEGPKLIEINTNAGGAFLNAFIRRAQRACCAEVETATRRPSSDEFESRIFAMFAEEWRRQRGAGLPARVAIVDDDPEKQYLYPEFILAQRFFEERGIAAIIADAATLVFDGARLIANNEPVDLVYNRIVDFDLSEPRHSALNQAYRAGAAVVTPGPGHHALLADKRNLALLSDTTQLREWGLDETHLSALAGQPRAIPVAADNAQELWADRKRWFFKPFAGHAGKAVYRGDKLTKSVWERIVAGGYLAQEIAAPGERVVEINGAPQTLKKDVRVYTYDSEILLAAARLYQGQTTNFRTEGGGFAPVFIVDGEITA